MFLELIIPSIANSTSMFSASEPDHLKSLLTWTTLLQHLVDMEDRLGHLKSSKCSTTKELEHHLTLYKFFVTEVSQNRLKGEALGMA
uniref:Uncharacterized protein n=1 Tax=Ditylenchus dipsaci TaxID=166011 RepID=A0A915DZ67_9BILA